jgi:hypothetical protein
VAQANSWLPTGSKQSTQQMESNMTTKKHAANSAVTKSAVTSRSMPKEGRDPRGGLNAIGREWYNRTQGANLKPGVRGPANTPEKMRRKGSFLTRHFTTPRGPMLDAKGRATRLALSAHAWGEPVPKSMAEAQALAAEGRKLLERYHAAKKAVKKTAAKKTAVKKTAAKKTVAKKTAANKAGTRSSGKRAQKSAAK